MPRRDDDAGAAGRRRGARRAAGAARRRRGARGRRGLTRVRGRHAPVRHGQDQALVPLPRYEQLREVGRRRDLAAARLRPARPRLAARRRDAAPRVRGGRAVAADAARALGQLAVRRRRGRPGCARRGPSGCSLMPTGGTPPALPRLGRRGSGDRRRRDAPALGRVAAARVRDARGARDGQADRRPPLGRLRGDRPGAGRRESPASARAGAVRPRALRADGAREAARRPPDPDEVAALAALVEPGSPSAARLAELVLDGRPEAERQLELGPPKARRSPDVVARTLAFGRWHPDRDDPGQRHPLRAVRDRLAAALAGHDGLEAANANLMGEVTLTWDDEQTDREELLARSPSRLPRARAGLGVERAGDVRSPSMRRAPVPPYRRCFVSRELGPPLDPADRGRASRRALVRRDVRLGEPVVACRLAAVEVPSRSTSGASIEDPPRDRHERLRRLVHDVDELARHRVPALPHAPRLDDQIAVLHVGDLPDDRASSLVDHLVPPHSCLLGRSRPAHTHGVADP